LDRVNVLADDRLRLVEFRLPAAGYENVGSSSTNFFAAARKVEFLILWNLASGPRRFGELRRLVAGVSQKMLIQELKEMVADGVAVRLEYREVPPKVELPAYRPGNVARGSLKPALRVGK
jgi:hypothetical protein